MPIIKSKANKHVLKNEESGWPSEGKSVIAASDSSDNAFCKPEIKPHEMYQVWNMKKPLGCETQSKQHGHAPLQVLGILPGVLV